MLLSNVLGLGDGFIKLHVLGILDIVEPLVFLRFIRVDMIIDLLLSFRIHLFDYMGARFVGVCIGICKVVYACAWCE